MHLEVEDLHEISTPLLSTPQNIQMTKTEKNKIQKLKPTHTHSLQKWFLKIFIFRRKEGRTGEIGKEGKKTILAYSK